MLSCCCQDYECAPFLQREQDEEQQGAQPQPITHPGNRPYHLPTRGARSWSCLGFARLVLVPLSHLEAGFAGTVRLPCHRATAARREAQRAVVFLTSPARYWFDRNGRGPEGFPPGAERRVCGMRTGTFRFGFRRRSSGRGCHRRGSHTAHKHVWRARIILLTADGLGTMATMAATGTSKTTVWRRRARFDAEAGVGRAARADRVGEVLRPGTCRRTRPPTGRRGPWPRRRPSAGRRHGPIPQSPPRLLSPHPKALQASGRVEPPIGQAVFLDPLSCLSRS